MPEWKIGGNKSEIELLELTGCGHTRLAATVDYITYGSCIEMYN